MCILKSPSLALLFMLIFSGISKGQEAKHQPDDPFAQAYEKNRSALEKFITQTKVENDPLLRCLIYLERVIQINKYLKNQENWPTMTSSMAEDPETPEQRKRALEAVTQNQLKAETMNLNADLRNGILEEMGNEIGKLDPKYQRHLKLVLDAVRNK